MDDREDSAKKSATHWELIRRVMSNPEFSQAQLTPGEQELETDLQVAWMAHQRAFHEWKALYYGEEVDEHQMYLDAQEELSSPEPDPGDTEATTRRTRAGTFIISVEELGEALDTAMAELNFESGDLQPEDDTP